MSRRLRLLLVTPHPIWPPTHGWSVRLWNLVTRFSKEIDVYALIFTGGTDDPAQRAALAPYCREVFFQQFQPGDMNPGGLPALARPVVSAGIARRIAALVSAHELDLVQLDGTELVGLLPLPSSIPVVVTAIDLGFETHLRRSVVRLGRFGSGDAAPLSFREALRFARYEVRGLGLADQVHCMSGDNARLLSRVAPKLRSRLRVVPNGVDCEAMKAAGELARSRADVLMLGSFPHAPNSDAVEYFLAKIWPRVRSDAPEAGLTLAGASPPPWVLELDGQNGVRVAGEVADVRPLLWSHAVLAVPLRAGSGTRIKILEAMGAELPVVSTRIGAAGIGGRDGQELQIASRPSTFASDVARLLGDPDRAALQAAKARAFVSGKFDWNSIANRALEAYGELVAKSRSPRREIVDSRPNRPEIEVLVPCPQGLSPSRSFLDALSALDFHLPFNIRFVSNRELPEELAADLSRRNIEWSRVPSATAAVGAILDAAIRESDASRFAILGVDDVPCSPAWLGHILWPLLQPAPPAVVVGEIASQSGGPRESDGSNAEREISNTRSNLSLHRSTWKSHPFGELADGGNDWKSEVEAAHLLVLRTRDAPAVRNTESRGRWGRPGPSEVSAVRSSIVVCTHDRGSGVLPTLQSLFEMRAPLTWEAVVVDNGSGASARLQLEDAVGGRHPNVHLRNEPTVGLSAARNAGVRQSAGEIVVFLDDDAVPCDGWLEALVAAFDDPEVDAAGGPVEPEWGGPIPDWLTPQLFPYLSAWDLGPEPLDLRYNETPRGANMAFRREVFDRVGLFSPHLGRRGSSLRSCEEVELNLRIERAGGRIRYVPAARVRHRTPVERLTPDWMEARFRQQGLSEAIVDWMHGGAGGLRKGLSRRANESPSGGPSSLLGRFERAANRGYRRGALIAVATVPRLYASR